MSIHDYLIDTGGFDWPRQLSMWAWLLPEGASPWLMNRFGGLFLIYPDGAVHMLDVGRVELGQPSRSPACRSD